MNSQENEKNQLLAWLGASLSRVRSNADSWDKNWHFQSWVCSIYNLCTHTHKANVFDRRVKHTTITRRAACVPLKHLKLCRQNWNPTGVAIVTHRRTVQWIVLRIPKFYNIPNIAKGLKGDNDKWAFAPQVTRSSFKTAVSRQEQCE